MLARPFAAAQGQHTIVPGRAAGISNHNFLAWEPKRPLSFAFLPLYLLNRKKAKAYEGRFVRVSAFG
ncbi:hypothetical protein QYS48_34175 [Marivirga arenosa]|uniref:Uncharacterized protein n=1 Tax=Marivirga arenosa TaxID=3059076 RepID=A0AA51N9C7_9BACT|nr:hypothetical protein [Marivirga sp. ABR2-2]WMN06901.1 hypothetical protein QYS48_34175 [Marivirga sp. ABR2-2]